MWHSINIKWYDFPDWIDSLSITYNLSPMYYEAIKKAGYKIKSLGKYLNNQKCKDRVEFFWHLLNELLGNPKKYKKMNPDNGRWSYDWLVRNLTLLIIACREKPNGIINDWY